MTFSACAYALKCLIDPDLPVNDGFYRLGRASTHRRASVTNCSWPGPVVGGWETQDTSRRGHVPRPPARTTRRAPAGTKGMMCQAGLRLDWTSSPGGYTCFSTRSPAGTAGRYASDGPDAVQAHRQNTENAPIEETELNYPVRIDRLGLVEDSEGPGRFRGGLGLRKDYRFDEEDDLHGARRPRPQGPVGRLGGQAALRRRVRAGFGVASRRGSGRRRVDLLPTT